MATESFVLNVLDVVEETADAHSIVFEVPDELQEQFAYTPGQFLTVAVPSDQTGLAARCYSLSSAPHSGRHQITVKRTVDGYASNWICDNLREGDTLRVLPPSGIFTPRDLEADLLLFAGGSGITPIMSITRTALEKGHGKVVLFYANRDEALGDLRRGARRAGGGVRRPAGRRALARVGAGASDAGAAASRSRRTSPATRPSSAARRRT